MPRRPSLELKVVSDTGGRVSERITRASGAWHERSGQPARTGPRSHDGRSLAVCRPHIPPCIHMWPPQRFPRFFATRSPFRQQRSGRAFCRWVARSTVRRRLSVLPTGWPSRGLLLRPGIGTGGVLSPLHATRTQGTVAFPKVPACRCCLGRDRRLCAPAGSPRQRFAPLRDHAATCRRVTSSLLACPAGVTPQHHLDTHSSAGSRPPYHRDTLGITHIIKS